MKYSSSNKPIQCMMTQSTCYKGTRKMQVLGVLWHSTGANNPTIKRYVQPDDNAPDREYLLKLIGTNKYHNDWNHIEREAGLNAWIGKLADGTVATVQTMPWDYRPWGCGSGNKGSCNNGWIQFEICEDGLDNADYLNKVYNEALELTAYLCKMFNLDPNGTVNVNGVKVPVITCHGDANKLGVGSNHGDINHWFPKYGKSMKTVRADLTKMLGSISGSTTEPTNNIEEGDLVKIASDATYYSGKPVPKWVKNLNWYVLEVSGDRAVIDKSEDGKNSICSPINTKYLTPVNKNTTEPPKPVEPPKPKVKTYQVVVDLPRYNSCEEAKKKTGSKGTYAPGTYYIYSKYPDGLNGMFNISTDKTGNSAGSWINPAENVAAPKPVDPPKPVEPEKPVEELYRVRITWEDSKTQKGAYKKLDSAKKCADANAADGYRVFNIAGQVVYTPTNTTPAAPEKPADQPVEKPTEPPVTPVEPEKPSEPEKPVDTAPVYNNPTAIIGYVDEDRINCVKAFKKIRTIYPEFNKDIAVAFFNVAPKYRINPVIAISQSILETGWFRFRGSSVKPEQNNFCGLGATGGGVAGAAFDTIEEGVHAQCQHLFAYGCKDELPEDITLLDPRFKLVSRGIAKYWEELAGKWACPGYDSGYSNLKEAAEHGATYGQKFLKIRDQLVATEVSDEEVDEFYAVETPVVPDQPDEPVTPDVPDEPVQPDEPAEPEVPDEPTDKDQQLDEIESIWVRLIKAIINFVKSLFHKQ